MSNILWDDPEEYPEDDDDLDDVHPGDPPQGKYENGPDAIFPVCDTLSIERRLIPDMRERRRRRIEDHFATRDYREKQKGKLAEERKGFY